MPTRQPALVRPTERTDNEAWKMAFSPDEPRSDDDEEKEQISPVEQKPETQPRFTKKNGEKDADGREIEKGREAFRQAGEASEEPKAREPHVPESAALITANQAEESTGNECAKNRLWHYHPPEQKRAGGTEMDQPGRKSAPVAREAFAD